VAPPAERSLTPHNAPPSFAAVTEVELKSTPLYEEHRRAGAKIVPFGGWLMPVMYSGINDEHQAVRNNVGVFDISHMGQLIASGARAAEWLNRMLTNNVDKLEVRAANTRSC
jgi:aminomethyltransferase